MTASNTDAVSTAYLDGMDGLQRFLNVRNTLGAVQAVDQREQRTNGRGIIERAHAQDDRRGEIGFIEHLVSDIAALQAEHTLGQY